MAERLRYAGSFQAGERFSDVIEIVGDALAAVLDEIDVDARLGGETGALLRGAEINREKTRVVQMRDEGATLDFLGYTFRWSRSHRPGGGPRYWRAEASSKAQERARLVGRPVLAGGE